MVGTTTPLSQAPANVTPPSISGVPAVGRSLSCSPGAWSGQPAPGFAYQWLRDGAAIAGATTTDYTVQNTDQGHGLSCEVTATNGAGSEQASSQTVRVPSAMLPVDVTLPSISGDPAVGQPLSCSPGVWLGEPTPEYSYQWLRDGQPAAGATAALYTVGSVDQGHGLVCEVTAHNSTGSQSASSNTLEVAGEQASGGAGSGSSGSVSADVLSDGSVSDGGLSGAGAGSLGGVVSNAFALARVAPCVTGQLKLTFNLPGPGTLQVIAKSIMVQSSRVTGRGVRGARGRVLLIAQMHLIVTSAGQMIVTLTPTGKAKRMLAKQGQLKAAITITYIPQGGKPRSIARSVTFGFKRQLKS